MNVRTYGKGFTLIELIIIIIILGVLAAVAIPKYLDMRQDSANATARSVLGGLRGANSMLWGNRVIQNASTPYTFGDLLGSLDMKGGLSWDVAAAGATMTLTVGGATYLFTMGTTGQAYTASPPYTMPMIFGSYGDW